MKARSPFDGKWWFFYDKCLAFGAAISCAHFQMVSDSVAFLVRWKTQKLPINYLDDYLFASFLKCYCNQQLKIFIEICGKIGMPINLEKTQWASTQMTFLGFLIDTIRRLVFVPYQKVIVAQNMIDFVLNKKSKKLTLLQLQKICGFLNFLCRVIVPGRAFMQRLYSQLTGFKTKLTPHHHIKITNEMRMDLKMWLEFLRHQSVFCRKFLDFSQVLTAHDIQFYMDASKNRKSRIWG